MNEDNLLEVDYDIPSLNDLGFEEFEVNENSVFKFKGGETTGRSRVDDYFLEQKMYLIISTLVTVYLEKTTVQNFHPGLQMDHYQLNTFIISLWNMKMM